VSRPAPVVIGWTEYVHFPEWGIRRLRAKVDTGARSSAIHVEHIRELPGDRVCFEVVLNRKTARRVRVETAIRRRGRVRSSSGHQTSRIFVATRIRLGPEEREIELSLVDRGEMTYRMLLGRAALRRGFLVDVGRRMLVSAPPPGRRTRPR
jgi:hypothetical protein